MKTPDLFSSHTDPVFETLIADAGSLSLCRAFVEAEKADTWFRQLRDEIGWEQRQITLYGKQVDIPRLSAWYGDRQAVYRYSGILHLPKPWIPVLTEIRRLIEARLKENFNAVLLNLYRDAHDSVAWHSDDEPELSGSIASLSLGESRCFRLKKRSCKNAVVNEIVLHPGDLLLMDEYFQQYWFHSIPKSREVCGPRINLTFRKLKNPADEAAVSG